MREGEGERGRERGGEMEGEMRIILETIKIVCNKKKEMYILTCKRWASEGLLNI